MKLETFNIFNADGTLDREMLNLAARQSHKESNDEEMEKALKLSSAGWTPFLHSGHTPHPFTGTVDVMSWFWRRPGKRHGKPGRVFRSTNQAYIAFNLQQP